MNVLLILGMHRSGTSALARCLRGMGISFDLPNIKDGFWEKHIEYYEINRLNDQILKSWKYPVLNRNPATKFYYKNKVAKFIKGNIPTDKLVCIKDPRLLLTYDYWAPNMDSVKIIGIFRRPEEVATSLSIRDAYGKASFSQGLDLWKTYNERFLSIHDKHQFPLLDFNDSKASFGKRLELACNKLDIPFQYEVFDEIFTDRQKHHYSENIPPQHLKVYNDLKGLVGKLPAS